MNKLLITLKQINKIQSRDLSIMKNKINFKIQHHTVGSLNL